MMKRTYYIKLFRSITEWEHYKDGNTARLFLHLLLMAVRKQIRYGKITLNCGQFVSTSRALSEELCISTKYITESIKKLRESGEIKTERCEYGTIFTVLNYDKYQGAEPAEPKEKGMKPKGGNGLGYDDF